MEYKKTASKKFGILLGLVTGLTLLLAACGDSTPNTREAFPIPVINPNAGAISTRTAGPVPGTVLKFPEDEAPHNDLTEWWYYTGHVLTADGQRYGLEFVVFQGVRTGFPVGYASHFAITDPQTGTFKYNQRTVVANNFTPGGTSGFNLKLTNTAKGDWSIRGVGGTDYLKANMEDRSYAIDLTVKDIKGIALHGGGQFTYGAGGSSYYYSRPRMSPSGTITVGGQTKQVTGGQIWFDKQWGNFLPLAGGWDWFSTQLDDNSELMFYNLRDKDNNIIQVFGTYIPPCQGECIPNKPLKAVDLEAGDLTIKANGSWTSPKTGITWPQGWTITIKPKAGIPAMQLTYNPVLPNQELDVRQSTATIYWEGDTNITGTKDGNPVAGSGYVELTGYNLPPK